MEVITSTISNAQPEEIHLWLPLLEILIEEGNWELASQFFSSELFSKLRLLRSSEAVVTLSDVFTSFLKLRPSDAIKIILTDFERTANKMQLAKYIEWDLNILYSAPSFLDSKPIFQFFCSCKDNNFLECIRLCPRLLKGCTSKAELGIIREVLIKEKNWPSDRIQENLAGMKQVLSNLTLMQDGMEIIENLYFHRNSDTDSMFGCFLKQVLVDYVEASKYSKEFLPFIYFSISISSEHILSNSTDICAIYSESLIIATLLIISASNLDKLSPVFAKNRVPQLPSFGSEALDLMFKYFQSGCSLTSFRVLEDSIRSHFHSDFKLTPDSNDVIFTILEQSVDYLIDQRLKSSHGRPLQTLEYLESLLTKCLESTSGNRCAYFLLQLIDLLEKAITIARTENSSFKRYPITSQKFFKSNQKVCDTFFYRMRGKLVSASMSLQSSFITHHFQSKFSENFKGVMLDYQEWKILF